MFTGLVECTGTIELVEFRSPGRLIRVRAANATGGVSIGDSVAVSGCCLTVVEIGDGTWSFEAGEETLSRTTLGGLSKGDCVNLERSLTVGQSIGGHFVTGHIDGVGNLNKRVDDGDWSTCWFSVPPALSFQLASKGSVAVDGVSLTLVEVDAESFSVALIPHTLAVTTLGSLQDGDAVNIETDILAKYTQRYLEGTK